MNFAYHHLALADVRPGMVLSDVLLDRQGQVLLPRGAVLTSSLIALLPRHGIERLAVLRSTAEGELPPPIDEAAVSARLAHLFRHTEQASASTALHQCLLDYRLEREPAA